MSTNNKVCQESASNPPACANRSTVLSLDLDYFNYYLNLESLDQVFSRILTLNVPMLLVDSHEKMVGFINRYKFDTLINMDEHSDMMSISESKKHCGSWVNFINHDNQSRTYIWLVPSTRLSSDTGVTCDVPSGRCDGIPGFYTAEKEYLRPWRKVKRTSTQRVINWREVKCVGIALSRDYTMSVISRYFEKTWLDKLLVKGIKLGGDVRDKEFFERRRASLIAGKIPYRTEEACHTGHQIQKISQEQY